MKDTVIPFDDRLVAGKALSEQFPLITS
jgi:hypothetical protein